MPFSMGEARTGAVVTALVVASILAATPLQAGATAAAAAAADVTALQVDGMMSEFAGPGGAAALGRRRAADSWASSDAVGAAAPPPAAPGAGLLQPMERNAPFELSHVQCKSPSVAPGVCTNTSSMAPSWCRKQNPLIVPRPPTGFAAATNTSHYERPYRCFGGSGEGDPMQPCGVISQFVAVDMPVNASDLQQVKKVVVIGMRSSDAAHAATDIVLLDDAFNEKCVPPPPPPARPRLTPRRVRCAGSGRCATQLASSRRSGGMPTP